MSKLKKCVGKESFQRMNYLYQISNVVATESTAGNSASLLYSNLLINISKKTVQRLDVPIKRNICKGCRGILLAGLTCKVRIKKKKVIWTCLRCMTAKTFETKNRDYQLWGEKDESVSEILDYKSQEGT